MSIINQMLKDLEKRKHTPMSSDIALPALSTTVFYSHKKPQKKNGILSVALFLVLFSLIFSYKFIFMHHSALTQTSLQSNATIQSNIMPSAIANNPIITPLHLTPSILTAITLQLDKDTTSLRLLLSQDALYQITTNSKNQLIILLENARLVASLPPINTINSAVKDIKMINQRDGNLQIVLTLKEGSELTHLELNETGKLPELQLDLLSASTFYSSQTKSAANNHFVSQQNGSIIKLRTDLSMSDQYQQALQLSTEGHSHDAIRALTALLGKNPEYAAARESLASLLIARGETIQAEQVIKIGLQQRPFYPAYVQLKARILVNEGKIREALNLLQMAPPMLTTNPDYHAFIAGLYQRQGQPVFAEKLYEQLLAVQPNNATWWMGLGIALESMGKSTLAMEAYVKAGNSDHLSPELKIYAESRVHNLQMTCGET